KPDIKIKPAVPQDPPKEEEKTDADPLPVYAKESTDPTLPGTWYIVDRAKPLKKIVDRPSLVPTGPKTKVMFDIGLSFVPSRAGAQYCYLKLPVDVGAEQVFLGCLPTVTKDDGSQIDARPRFFQSRAQGNRVLELAFDCPANVPVNVALKGVVLVP